MSHPFRLITTIIVFTLAMAITTQPQTIPARQVTSVNDNEAIQSLNSRVSSLNRSTKVWTAWYLGLGLIAVLATAATFVAQFFSVRRAEDLTSAASLLSSAKDRSLAAQLKEKDLKIEEASERASRLELRASEAEERTKLAEVEISKANADAHDAMARVAIADSSSKEAVARVAEAQRASVEASAKAEGFRLDIARANERAAEADLARRQLEMKLATMFAPRVLAPEQAAWIKGIVASIQPAPVVNMTVFGDTPEIAGLVNSLTDAIAASWPIQTIRPSGTGSMQGVAFGVRPDAPKELVDSVRGIVAVLKLTLGGGVEMMDFDRLIYMGPAMVLSPGTVKLGAVESVRIFIGAK